MASDAGQTRPVTAEVVLADVRRLQLARRGELKATCEFIESFAERLYVFLASALGEEEAASRALLDLLDTVRRDLRQLDEHHSLAAQIFRRTAFVARSLSRAQGLTADGLRLALGRLGGLLPVVAADTARPVEAAATTLREEPPDPERVRAAFGRLPYPHRVVVLLVDVVRLSRYETAEALDMEPGAVDVLANEARAYVTASLLGLDDAMTRAADRPQRGRCGEVVDALCSQAERHEAASRRDLGRHVESCAACGPFVDIAGMVPDVSARALWRRIPSATAEELRIRLVSPPEAAPSLAAGPAKRPQGDHSPGADERRERPTVPRRPIVEPATTAAETIGAGWTARRRLAWFVASALVLALVATLLAWPSPSTGVARDDLVVQAFRNHALLADGGQLDLETSEPAHLEGRLERWGVSFGEQPAALLDGRYALAGGAVVTAGRRAGALVAYRGQGVVVTHQVFPSPGRSALAQGVPLRAAGTEFRLLRRGGASSALWTDADRLHVLTARLPDGDVFALARQRALLSAEAGPR